jgi:hypothetical protein
LFTVLKTEKFKFKVQVDLVSHEGFLSESKMERWYLVSSCWKEQMLALMTSSPPKDPTSEY